MASSLTSANVATVNQVKFATLGPRNKAVRAITGDASYPTGGYSIQPQLFGLSRIVYGGVCAITSTPTAAVAEAQILPQTDGSVLLRLVAATGLEVANATNVSTVVIQVAVEGW